MNNNTSFIPAYLHENFRRQACFRGPSLASSLFADLEGPRKHGTRRPCRREESWSLCPQLQQREEFCQIDQPLGLRALLRRQRLAGVLTVEESLQAGSNGFRQPETVQVGGEFDLEGQSH